MQSNSFKLIAGAALSCVLLSAAVPASATRVSCSIDLVNVWSGCSTDSIRANARNHFIHVHAWRFVTWQVKDINSNVIVARGASGIRGTDKTITGLYGTYKGYASNSATALTISGRLELSND